MMDVSDEFAEEPLADSSEAFGVISGEEQVLPLATAGAERFEAFEFRLDRSRNLDC